MYLWCVFNLLTVSASTFRYCCAPNMLVCIWCIDCIRRYLRCSVYLMYFCKSSYLILTKNVSYQQKGILFIQFIYSKTNEITLFNENESFAEVLTFWFHFSQGGMKLCLHNGDKRLTIKWNELKLKWITTKRSLRFLFGFDYFSAPIQFKLQPHQWKRVTVKVCTDPTVVTGGH